MLSGLNNDEYYSAGPAINDGEKHSIAIVSTEETVLLYVDGVKYDTGFHVNSGLANNVFYIGGNGAFLLS